MSTFEKLDVRIFEEDMEKGQVSSRVKNILRMYYNASMLDVIKWRLDLGLKVHRCGEKVTSELICFFRLPETKRKKLDAIKRFGKALKKLDESNLEFISHGNIPTINTGELCYRYSEQTIPIFMKLKIKV